MQFHQIKASEEKSKIESKIVELCIYLIRETYVVKIKYKSIFKETKTQILN